jgi:hypothetical protein
MTLKFTWGVKGIRQQQTATKTSTFLGNKIYFITVAGERLHSHCQPYSAVVEVAA